MLEVSGLGKTFGSLRAVDNVDVAVDGGVCLGIMGPNGAGKSTLFDLLTGVTRADGGRILVNGLDITSMTMPARVRAGLARAFQVPRPFHSMTVRETLLLALHAATGRRGTEARAAAEELLAEVGLEARADTLSEDLRLLDRKRLELAKALACAPKVILLDEVSGGLTAAEVRQMMTLIDTLRRRGLAVLWVEHIAHALQEVCDRIMMMHMGAVVIDAPPEETVRDANVRRLYLGTEP